MDVIIDANVLFAALIKEGCTIDLILDEDIRLFAPEIIFEEFDEHKDEILAKTRRTRAEFDEAYEGLKSIMSIIPSKEFLMFKNEAWRLTKDKDDVHYLALALKLKIPVWFNDKGMKDQDKVKVYTTEEMMRRVRGR